MPPGRSVLALEKKDSLGGATLQAPKLPWSEQVQERSDSSAIQPVEMQLDPPTHEIKPKQDYVSKFCFPRPLPNAKLWQRLASERVRDLGILCC